MLQQIKSFLKKETVLTIAFFLASISCFLVTPDAEYAGYVDMHTILILFCLMAVMAGFKEMGLFQRIGETLLNKFHSERGIAFILIFLCFVSSMFITNDVALITFVPLAILVLGMAEMNSAACFIITLMTIAANLGSMLTPIGNPQNLYLYSVSGMSLTDFLLLMLPCTLAAAVLLILCIWFGFKSREVTMTANAFSNAPSTSQSSAKSVDYTAASDTQKSAHTLQRSKLIYYFVLFLLCLLCVANILSVYILFAIILIAVFLDNRKLLLKIDYSLLATFVCFFIFIGNMGRFPAFRDFIMNILEGRARLVSVAISQVISNVPAALLLSGFTNEWSELIIGTNLGGLGTLIASMASLISYKQLAAQYPEKKGHYMMVFTLWNVIFLAVLYPVSVMLR